MFSSSGNDKNSALNMPASFPSVVSVGAVDSAQRWANFSNANWKTELAAPGVDILSTVVPGALRSCWVVLGSVPEPAAASAGCWKGCWQQPGCTWLRQVLASGRCCVPPPGHACSSRPC
jgi:serine protease